MGAPAGRELRPPGPVIDVSGLPPFAFGHRSILWWGTALLFVVEGTTFALALASYFYLRGRQHDWPPAGTAPPDLLWGSLNMAILLLSCVPNELCKRAAEKLELRPTQIWLVVCMLFTAAFLAVRGVEFAHLNTSWTTSAYGSIVYAIMLLHTTHLVTEAYDSGVLTVLMFTRNVEGKRFLDVSENAVYWYFVVACWIPVYVTIYLAPRWL
jgi:cytochrome c oxidase subunit 3